MARVHLLGGLEVEGVPALALGSRKGRAVLRRLAAAAGAVVAEDELVEVAWPEGAPVRAKEQLPVLVSRLRSALGSDRIVRQDAGYRLLTDWLDVTEVDAAAAALPALPPAAALQRGRDALQLLRGPLLPEEELPWVDEARSQARDSAQALRRVTAQAALRAGLPRECTDLARTCLAEDPYDETVLRLLMEAALAGGLVPAALQAYEQTAERLADELGVDPSPETRALHLRLLQRTAEPAQQSPAATGRRGLVAAVLASPEPSLHLVLGIAGMGKSTLLDQLAAAATTHVLRVQGDATGLGVPLQPVLDALPDLRLSGPLESTAARALTGGADRAAVARAVAQALEELGPTLLLVDDGQLLDAASATLLQHLCRPGSRTRVTVVVAARPGAGPDWGSATVHELDPLTLEDTTALVGPARAQELHERSGGHPLFLAELARSQEGLPGDVLAAVAHRFSRSPELTEVLRAAAVLGTSIDVDVLSAVLDRPASEVVDQLDSAVAQQLLRSTADGYAFAHDLHREALTSLVTPARATLLHRAAAQAIAARGSTARLGHHALAGGDDELAASALAAAAEVASVRYEHEQALAMLERAVSLAATPKRRLQQARALVMVGRYDEADAEARNGDDEDTHAEALEVRALAAYLQRELDSALELATHAATATTDPERAAGCLALAARIRLGRGDLERAEADLREAMALSTGQVRGVAAVWLAVTLTTRGDAEEGYAVVTSPATRLVRSLPLVEPHRHLAHGRALAMLGRPAEAIEVFDRLRATVEEQHVLRFAGRAENFRAWVLRNLGATAEAQDANQQAWDAVQALDPVTGAEARGHAILDLADAALRGGDLSTAEHWLDLARKAELAPHIMKWRFDLRRDLLAGRFALTTGDADGALELAARVRDGAQQVGVDRFVVQAGLLAAHAEGRPAEDVARLAGRLAEVAPLESWWLLADLGPEFRDQARSRVEALLPHAGPWAEDLRKAAQSLA